LQIAVLRGDAQSENQPQVVSLKKNETLTVDPGQPADYKITHGTEPLPVDAWNKEREAYSNAYSGNQGYGGPHTGYGLQDLNYYGDYFYAPGYGYAWQPYGFANSMIGWSPYSNGAWAFVPGFGYSWASAYPWGWLPFHYGSWAFLGGGIGWAWVPGSYPGQWYVNNFQATPVITKSPAGYQPLSAPAAPKGSASAPTILVGKAAGSLAIPGGRITPNFASVIPGRNFDSAGATNRFVSQNARNELSVNRYGMTPPSMRGANAGHVFANPHSSGMSAGSVGSASVGGMGYSAAGRGGSTASGSGHSSGSGGHSGSGH